MGRYEKAILKTICYGAVFNYPLTKSQIWKFLIWDIKSKPRFSSFISTIDNLLKAKKIYFSKDLYFLETKHALINNRKKQEKIAQRKIKIAKRVSSFISFIPTIELIGLSGKLAMKTAEKEDDIDLFIIVQKHTLWITRFLTASFLTFLGLKRSPGKIAAPDRVCLNMIVDTNNLTIPKNEQDLFSAHEVVQMKPLFTRNNSYDKFINSNSWVKSYLPNTVGERKRLGEKDTKTYTIFSLFEKNAQKFQLGYMQKRKTTEIVRSGYVRFHPRDMRNWILPEYNRLVKSLKH